MEPAEKLLIPEAEQPQWYALRDFRRPNARQMGWEQLETEGFQVFTPLKWTVRNTPRGPQRRQRAIVPDLLFVRSTRQLLDEALHHIPTLQYRYARGRKATPLTVRASDMALFIHAIRSATTEVRYYRPDEITPDMYGRQIRIIGGPLDGYSGHLLYLRGSHAKRLLIQLPGFLTAAIEITPSYIQLL